VHISCRNRHCPKCQALARALWLEARKADLLPVPYFHVVFTIPEPIAAIALQNKRVVYDNLTTPRCHLGCPAASPWSRPRSRCGTPFISAAHWRPGGATAT